MWNFPEQLFYRTRLDDCFFGLEPFHHHEICWNKIFFVLRSFIFPWVTKALSRAWSATYCIASAMKIMLVTPELYLRELNLLYWIIFISWKFLIVDGKAKRRISKRVFQEIKARQIFRKSNIFYSLIRRRTCTYQRVRNVRFSENLAGFIFLKHPFWDSPFCLITNVISFCYKIIN